MRFLLVEAWYSLDVALLAAVGILAVRVVRRLRHGECPGLESETCSGTARRWAVNSANGTTKLQILVWGTCVARQIEWGLGGHTLIYPGQARTFSFSVVMVALGAFAVIALDAAGRLIAFPRSIRWNHDPWTLLILAGLLATCTILLASGWGMVSLFVESSRR